MESTLTRLSLGRKEGESVYIDGPCKVTLVRCIDGKARLMFEAESHVLILRSELLRSDGEERAA